MRYYIVNCGLWNTTKQKRRAQIVCVCAGARGNTTRNLYFRFLTHFYERSQFIIVHLHPECTRVSIYRPNENPSEMKIKCYYAAGNVMPRILSCSNLRRIVHDFFFCRRHRRRRYSLVSIDGHEHMMRVIIMILWHSRNLSGTRNKLWRKLKWNTIELAATQYYDYGKRTSRTDDKFRARRQ